MRTEKQKALGQVFTPAPIAEFMSQLVLDGTGQTVLDPAVGNGVFLSCLEKLSPRKLTYTAYDIDKEVLNQLQTSVASPVQLQVKDYLTDFSDHKYDVIICNPPYHKFQEIPSRKEYIAAFYERFHMKISGFSNLCVYFLIKSLNELSSTGKCVYIMPYEFLNAGYGAHIKKYLLQTRRLKAIYKFDYKLNLFPDATTTSCILLFDGSQNDRLHFISLQDTAELQTRNYADEAVYSYHELDPEIKWNPYFSPQKTALPKHLVPFQEIAQVKRGIATGGNKFFCLSESRARDLKLSSGALVPCITKSADITRPVFTQADFQALRNANKKVFLFNGEAAQTPEDHQYIAYGKAQKINEGFLTSHRTPWFALEKRETAPIWISVFNRNKLKIVRNECGAKHLTTFHGIYVKSTNTDLINLFFCYLLTPSGQALLYQNKRDYGNGLDKFEPNDLNNAPVLDVSKLSLADKAQVLSIYAAIKSQGLTPDRLGRLDAVFSRYLQAPLSTPQKEAKDRSTPAVPGR